MIGGGESGKNSTFTIETSFPSIFVVSISVEASRSLDVVAVDSSFERSETAVFLTVPQPTKRKNDMKRSKILAFIIDNFFNSLNVQADDPLEALLGEEETAIPFVIVEKVFR